MMRIVWEPLFSNITS